MAHRKNKPRPKMRECVEGVCAQCWQICMRVNQVSCTIHGIPRNKSECPEFKEMGKTCECGSRLYFEEIMMPHPFKRKGGAFAGGHYFCEECGSIHRSKSGDGRYAEWVEDLVAHRRRYEFNSSHEQKEV